MDPLQQLYVGKVAWRGVANRLRYGKEQNGKMEGGSEMSRRGGKRAIFVPPPLLLLKASKLAGISPLPSLEKGGGGKNLRVVLAVAVCSLCASNFQPLISKKIS